jgi:hypothetical protein
MVQKVISQITAADLQSCFKNTPVKFAVKNDSEKKASGYGSYTKSLLVGTSFGAALCKAALLGGVAGAVTGKAVGFCAEHLLGPGSAGLSNTFSIIGGTVGASVGSLFGDSLPRPQR